MLSITSDTQIESVVILEDLNSDHVVTHVEHAELLPSPDIDLLLKDQQSLMDECYALNLKLHSKNALLTRDIECLKRQLNFFKTQENREKGFEVAFAKSHQNEKSLERQIRDLAASKNALLSVTPPNYLFCSGMEFLGIDCHSITITVISNDLKCRLENTSFDLIKQSEFTKYRSQMKINLCRNNFVTSQTMF